jgi:hypothetical protein
MRKLSVIAILALVASALMLVLNGGWGTSTVADTIATITTDQAKYSLGESMTITGADFTPSGPVDITVLRPDHETDTLPTVTADSLGEFSTVYNPPIIPGRYKITATDGANTAKTAATEADAIGNDISQCQNGGVGDPLQPCSESAPYPAPTGYGYEGNANANGQNSHWSEGDFVPIRIVGTQYPAGAGNIQFSIDVTKGGKHAYDYIGSFDSTETTGDSTLHHFNHNNPVSDIISGADPTAPDSTGLIPADPSLAVGAYPTVCGTNTWTDGAQPSGQYVKAWGTSGPLTVTYVSRNVGSSDCVTTIQVAWGATQAGFGGTIVIAYAPHIAAAADWGVGNSAIDISGSPYHSSLVQYTAGGVTKGIGQQDAKLAASAVVPEPETPDVTTAVHLGTNHTTDIQGTSIAVGSTVHDMATVGATPTFGTPSGTVTFSFFTNGTCTTPATATSAALALVSGSVDATTFPQGPLAAGSYSFKAHFVSGDPSKWTDSDPAADPCEPFTVSKASPGISTTPSAGGVIGVTLNDTAALSGGYNPTGKVTFKLFPPSDATCSGTAAYTEDDLTAPYATSTGFASNAVGVWHWTADYAGDANNNPVSSACAAEAVIIGKVTSEIGTDIHNSDHSVVLDGAARSSTVHDKATVVGYSPTGSVTFTFYTGGDCATGTPVVDTPADTVTLVGGIAHPSKDRGPLSAGFYAFKAHYNGDVNNKEADSDCEPFSVSTVTVIKTETVGGAPVDPIVTIYDFELTGGPDSVHIDKSTPPATLDFGVLPPGTYTLCELHVPAGTHSTLEDVVIGGDILSKSINTTTGDVCVTFTLQAGAAKVFNIDNSRPGGGQRTIGYWKNWNSCSHDGAFVDRAAKTGNHLADEFVNLTHPLNIGILQVDTCPEIVAILNKSDLSSKKSASDAAYNLAAQLLGADLNVLAGAGTCPAATNAISQAQSLLAAANFNGTGQYWKGGKNAAADRATALSLANTLDQYNNGKLCP